MINIHFKTSIAILLLFLSNVVLSNSIDSILTEKNAPPGVVFEVVSGEAGLLRQLLPRIKTDIEKLRNRFPGLPVAIVTHGKEQFDLTLKNQTKYKSTHQLVQSLVEQNDVDIHVCGTHAGWYGINPEDFPGYVNVSAAGPAQINDYEELGYVLIVLP